LFQQPAFTKSAVFDLLLNNIAITMSDPAVQGSNERWPIRYPSITIFKEEYKPMETSALTKTAFIYSTAIGGLTAATQNSLARDGRGPMAVFTKSGKLWGAIVAVVTTYQFSFCAVSNLREKSDALNDLYAGAASGAVLGSFSKSLSKTVGTALCLGALAGFTHWAGFMIGNREESAAHTRDEFGSNLREFKEGEKQGLWELSRRRPLSETKERLGEVFNKP